MARCIPSWLGSPEAFCVKLALMRLTVAIMVQFPDSSSIMLCHQDLPRGRDILWEIKSVSWHKKVALGSLPGLLRSYAPKYRRTMHMAWVLSAHCPALSLSLSLSGPLFVSLFAGDGPLEPAAEPRGLTLGPAACCRELLQVFTLHFVTSRAPCLRPAWNWVTAAQHTLSLWEHLVLWYGRW